MNHKKLMTFTDDMCKLDMEIWDEYSQGHISKEKYAKLYKLWLKIYWDTE